MKNSALVVIDLPGCGVKNWKIIRWGKYTIKDWMLTVLTHIHWILLSAIRL